MGFLTGVYIDIAIAKEGIRVKANRTFGLQPLKERGSRPQIESIGLLRGPGLKLQNRKPDPYNPYMNPYNPYRIPVVSILFSVIPI